ncbi:MAG: peptide chain release factor N(5)-glutamine methyltransferase [Christensenellaceae bacterium]|jgi:release factor-specific protein-(glutamine-N5) methyltransferase|nr:peptide chain release factor N(5)-glutamine methyltransferase [Christensenellaceae bacterium]
MEKKKLTKIGGQAVIEGVMMRGKSVMATCVRDPMGQIQTESIRFKPLVERSKIFKVPIIRGILSFVISMTTGMKTLMRAAEVYGDASDTAPSKFEVWLAEKLKLNLMSIIGAIGVLLGIVLAVGLFILLPNWITDGIYSLVSLDKISAISQSIIKNLTSGVIRIIIFVLYILLCTIMKDIKRLFSYHGAEHKTISCYEHGLPLTVENAAKMSRIHDRCGTTFMILVMVLGIIFFSFFGWQELWLRMLIRLAGIPLVAGISYEVLMFLAKFDNPFVRIIKAPGLLLQKVTTREPDKTMLEVAIKAFQTVLEMEEDLTIEESRFVTIINSKTAIDELRKLLGEVYQDEAEEILMSTIGISKRSEIKTSRITSLQFDKALAVSKDRVRGLPLQYALGEVMFYGFLFKADNRALVARPESELLVGEVIDASKRYENPKVIELCTGSGIVAASVSKTLNLEVVATDISECALALAKENAEKIEAKVKFIQSDMFEKIDDIYDIMVINPPYIPTADIDTLDESVKFYEPRLALDGGADGLDYYRLIEAGYKKCLREGGTLILEVGVNQSDLVANIFNNKTIKRVKDYNSPQIERVLVVTDEEI